MGTIEVGKFADMVVIDRDIFNIPEDELKDVQALNTYLAGNETYRRA
jgi:predicted amidohydrolase YtcJ